MTTFAYFLGSCAFVLWFFVWLPWQSYKNAVEQYHEEDY